jgi:BirA family biotin operon repressor/biotin-[acetyl-CoA-carboxylase] ligase
MDSASLLRVLADGHSHSGQALAARFGVTRAAVWKQVAKLERWGLTVEALPGVGYRLPRGLDLLDVGAVAAQLGPAASRVVERLDLFDEIDSTNAYLLRRRPAPGAMTVCLAEFQKAGRGRRGRAWRAPFAAGLCLSAGWHFFDAPPELPALTLAVGVAARRALEQVARVAVELKWPNDLVWEDRKLGGILVELVAEAQGSCHVVAGIGVNVAVPPEALSRLSDWPKGAVDLGAATGGAPPSRAALAAALVEALAELFGAWEDSGFAPYRSEYAAADYLDGRRVRVEDVSGALVGTARGLDDDGALRVEVAPGRYRRVISGDVSVRLGR